MQSLNESHETVSEIELASSATAIYIDVNLLDALCWCDARNPNVSKWYFRNGKLDLVIYAKWNLIW